MRHHRPRGFTLVETLVTVSVAGILSTIAWPSFESQLQRGRRTDALVSLMSVQLLQERWRSHARSYGTLQELGQTEGSPGGHYRLQVEDADARGYTVTATAVGVQARDQVCRVLQLRVRGADVQQHSGPDADATNTGSANRRCWNR